MRRPILIFLGAVLVPGLLLAVLAWRSIQGQEAVLLQERLRRIQSATDGLAQSVATRIDEHQRDFSLRVESLFGKEAPYQLAASFDDRIRDHWPLAQLGFAVSLSGDVLSPPILGRPEARQFLVNNNDFLCNRSSVQVFAVTPKGKIDLAELNRAVAATPLPNEAGTPAGANGLDGVRRFAQLIGDAQEGVLARVVDDQPVIWVWYRTPREPDLVFGAQLALGALRLNLGQLAETTT
ncbi:MAG: hypothetical protein JNL97_09800, partial [Verrucomicrobiales bacterium]|nr:hypothetical protein [Verrucomicrobiales bacterium]